MYFNPSRAMVPISLLAVAFALMLTMQTHSVSAQGATAASTAAVSAASTLGSTLSATTAATLISPTTSLTADATIVATLSSTLSLTSAATTSSTVSATLGTTVTTAAATVTTAATVAMTAPPATTMNPTANTTAQIGRPVVAPATIDLKKAAYIRALHVSPNAPAVDFYVGSQLIASNVTFGNGSGYLPVASGDVTLTVRSAGAAITTQPVGTLEIYLTTGVSATFAATGLLNGSGPTAFKVVVITSDRSPTKGKARVEVFHAAPAAGTVDVLVDNSPKLTEIKYGKPGNAPLNVPPATYHISIVATGTKTPVLIDAPNSALAADTIYTLVAVNSVTDTPNIVVLTAAPLPPAK